MKRSADIFGVGIGAVLILMLFASTSLFARGAGEADADVIELTFATINPGDSHLGRSAQAFADAIEQDSGGEIRVSVFPDATLGDASTLYDSVVSGDIDIVMSDTGWFAEAHPEFSVLEGSYLFRDGEHYQDVLNSPDGLAFFEELLIDNPGVRHMMYVGGMERNILSTYPIESISDLDGRTMRSRDVSTEIEWWELLGARPVPVAFAELYTAFQTGVVEGSQNSVDAMINMRFMEVADFIARTQHAIHLGMLVMNEERFQSLSQRHQEAILGAAQRVQPEYLALAFETTEDQLEMLQAEYDITVTYPDTGAFIEASREQVAELARELGIEDVVRETFGF